MLCSDCGKKEAFAKGLCQTCYARHRRKNGKKICSVDGCDGVAVSKGLCSKHSQRARKRKNAKVIPSVAGEVWKCLPDFPGLSISTMGRVKSTRRPNERLITPRVVNGRLFVDDRKNGSFAVHLQVLKEFVPNVVGDAVFLDGNPLNPSLENLRWDTRADKLARAISMAEESHSIWTRDFISFWQGNKNSLDNFFITMENFLSKTLYRKCEEYGNYYRLSVEEVAHEVLVKLFISIYSATLHSLDNLNAYALTVADNVLRSQYKYAKNLLCDVKYTGTGEESLVELSGFAYPSAENVAIYNEESRYTPD